VSPRAWLRQRLQESMPVAAALSGIVHPSRLTVELRDARNHVHAGAVVLVFSLCL
jgi:hypothetical protein